MNENSLILKILDVLFVVVGYPSVLIIGIMPIYLIYKHKSYNALAYWDYATLKERKIINSGYIGFLIAILVVILEAILS
ncbi:MAG: hypothetical protein GY865_13865 [candidate division Zixibacteria bacterium]|nr:hypothetical protein [candidate division Zixibacteria bacterium]